MKKFNTLSVILLAAFVSGTAMAHPEHDELPMPKTKLTKNLQFELVNAANGATVYVKNNDEKYSTTGATGTLTVTNGTAQSKATLQPAGDNAMKTKGSVKIAPGATAQASITFADKNTITSDVVMK